MAYAPHQLEWIHPFQAFRHNKSSSAAGRSDGVGKPFSVRPAADDDLNECLPGQTHGSFTRVILVGPSRGSNLWVKLVGHTCGLFSWFKLVGRIC